MVNITSSQRLPAIWQSELSSFHLCCLNAEGETDGELIIAGLGTLGLIPTDLVTMAGPAPNPVRIARLVEARAYLCAALEFLGKDAGYMLSRGGSGRAIASVVLPGAPGEITAEAASPALALLAAYSGALLAACGAGHAGKAPIVSGAVVH